MVMKGRARRVEDVPMIAYYWHIVNSREQRKRRLAFLDLAVRAQARDVFVYLKTLFPRRRERRRFWERGQH
jgi:hypothetical protein